jgi:hypothetical protein
LARKKKKKSSRKKPWFRSLFERKKKRGPSWVGPTLARLVKVAAVLAFLAGIVFGLATLDQYILETGYCSDGMAQLELVAIPDWVNNNLKEKVFLAAMADGRGLTTDPSAARRVQENICTLAGWLDDVQVLTMHDCLRVKGKWRKPLVLVKLGHETFYADADLVVLEHVPMPNLPIVEVKGLSPSGPGPELGRPWLQEDLAAAADIIVQLDRMDNLVSPKKPLLFEIDHIDVSNFQGRENPRLPHISLHTKDKTPIIWGAEIGQWTRHFEATDQDKLAKLYGYYKRAGTLLNAGKYINLRDPQDKVLPLPIDKY